ncbi:MAG: hypothetical protein SCH39_13165 [Methanosarcinales archaeon]|nr:hypothetical protein [Methanosarcinales archaeon]
MSISVIPDIILLVEALTCSTGIHPFMAPIHGNARDRTFMDLQSSTSSFKQDSIHTILDAFRQSSFTAALKMIRSLA